MNDPAFALFRHAMDDDVYLQYVENHDELRSSRKACANADERLRAMLSEEERRLYNVMMDEQMIIDSIELEAAFTAGLAFGLQLLRLS